MYHSETHSQQLACHQEAPLKGAFYGETVTIVWKTQDPCILKRPKCAHTQLSFVVPQLQILSLTMLANIRMNLNQSHS